MHGRNFGWVNKMKHILESSMNLTMRTSDMEQKISHMQMVNNLHTVVHYAATHHHKMIAKLLKVMKKHGYVKGYSRELQADARSYAKDMLRLKAVMKKEKKRIKKARADRKAKRVVKRTVRKVSRDKRHQERRIVKEEKKKVILKRKLKSLEKKARSEACANTYIVSYHKHGAAYGKTFIAKASADEYYRAIVAKRHFATIMVKGDGSTTKSHNTGWFRHKNGKHQRQVATFVNAALDKTGCPHKNYS